MALPNIQSLARFGQILSQLKQPTPSLPQGMVQPFGGFNQPEQEPEFDVDAEIAKLYQPRHQMQDLTGEMLGQFPERDPHPSVWRRIGAVMAGMGAGMHGQDPMQAANRFQNFHYYNDVADWKAKFDPLSKAADDERLANTQERLLAQQSVSQKQAQQKIGLQEKRDTAKAQNDEARTKIAADRAAVYRFKNSPQGQAWKILEPKGGFIMAVNPLTQQTITLKDDNNNPIPTGTLNDQDRINLGIEGRLEVTAAQGAQQRQNIAATGEQQRQNIAATGEQQRTTEAARPPRSSSGGSLEQIRARRNRAEQAKIEHPEWSRFIGLGPASSVIVTPPGRNGPTPEQHKAISDYLTGKETPKLLAPGLNAPGSFGKDIDAVIAEAVQKGMKKEDVIAELKKRGIIK